MHARLDEVNLRTGEVRNVHTVPEPYLVGQLVIVPADHLSAAARRMAF